MKTKDVGLRIRVEHELRDAFVDACRSQDKPAAQVLRDFMRRYVHSHKAANNTLKDTRPRGAARGG
jgi:hypothetical protein